MGPRMSGNNLVLEAIEQALPYSPALIAELQRTLYMSSHTTRSSIALGALTVVQILEEIEGEVPEHFIELAVQGLALSCVFAVEHTKYGVDPNVRVRDRDGAEAAARELDEDFVRVKNGVRFLVNIHLGTKRLSWLGRRLQRRDVRKLLDLFKPHIQKLERTLKTDFGELIERAAAHATKSQEASDSDSGIVLVGPATVQVQLEPGAGPTHTALEPLATPPRILVAGPTEAEGTRQPPTTPPAQARRDDDLAPGTPSSPTHGPSLSGPQHQPSVDDMGSMQGPDWGQSQPPFGVHPDQWGSQRLNKFAEGLDVPRPAQSYQSRTRGSSTSIRSGTSARSGRRRRYSDDEDDSAEDDDEEDARSSPSRRRRRNRSSGPSVVNITCRQHGTMQDLFNNYYN